MDQTANIVILYLLYLVIKIQYAKITQGHGFRFL